MNTAALTNLHLQIMQLQGVINSYFESNKANKLKILNLSKQLQIKDLQKDKQIKALILHNKKEKRKTFIIGAGSAIALISILSLLL